jgi:hypothetical protein
VTTVRNFERLLVEVSGEGDNPKPGRPGYLCTPDDLLNWLRDCAVTAKSNINDFKDDPQRKKQLIKAIGIVFSLASGDPLTMVVATTAGSYLVSQLIEDAGKKYGQMHPSWADQNLRDDRDDDD